MGDTTLGLDLGTNSIGWALIGHNEKGEPNELIGCGVRIFQEAVDDKTRVPKNHARRDARGARKLIARRKMRKNKLANILSANKFLPTDEQERNNILANNQEYDPYQLRAKALDEKLTPYELGRVLYHLNQRRGFQSNRKNKGKDDGVVKEGIASLKTKMSEKNSRTLGEYLAKQNTQRGIHTDRAMYTDEFNKIWETQKAYYPEILTPALHGSIHNAIFWQRPLKIQKNLVGNCTFEKNRKKAAKATLDAQRIRILQDVNSLMVKDPLTRDFRPLSSEERNILIKKLETQKTLSWGAARKALKLHDGEIFNLENGKNKELKGDNTSYALRSVIKDRWDFIDRDELITDMLTIDNEQGFLNRMINHHGFDEATAQKLLETELEPGYARLSQKAIKKILPYLEKGQMYHEACKSAKYNHSKPNEKAVSDRLPEPPYLRNPVVQKAMYETRKVINTLVRKYGKPDTIRVEMARDISLSKSALADLNKFQNEQKKRNDTAIKALQENPFNIQNPTRDDIIKYNLWKESEQICPYTGITISANMLFSPEVDVEHIIPYSRCLDDSYKNKTLCMAEENRKVKKQQTPYEAYHANETKYADILKNVKFSKMSRAKKLKFEQKEVDTDKFVSRQLNDTRYISTEVKDYLHHLGVNVGVSKGEATSVLRKRWNLNGILNPDKPEEKNRSDHRHHAVDAIVVALTDRSLFNQITRLSKTVNGASLTERGFTLPFPWGSFYNDVQMKVEDIIVSHAMNQKITGALHEETSYGHAYRDMNTKQDYFTYRKPINSLTVPMIDDIRDEGIKTMIKEKLDFPDFSQLSKDEAKEARKRVEKDMKLLLGDENNPLIHRNGQPIQSVRLITPMTYDALLGISEGQDNPYKFFALGNNHHVEIIEHVSEKNKDGSPKRKGIFVTAVEAAKRARIDKIPIVQKDHGTDWRFVMALHTNDVVAVKKEDKTDYYRMQKMSGANNTLILRHHLTTETSDTARSTIMQCTPNTIPQEVKKVIIDPIGQVYNGND